MSPDRKGIITSGLKAISRNRQNVLKPIDFVATPVSYTHLIEASNGAKDEVKSRLSADNIFSLYSGSSFIFLNASSDMLIRYPEIGRAHV